jgi:muconolactone delta-isomerase
MIEFMVHGAFRQEDQQNILERIPQERERIKSLMQQGTVEALYIASDFSGVWLVMKGESQDQVQKSLESLPLYHYMELTMTPLSRMET